jgi:hypothetical protein
MRTFILRAYVVALLLLIVGFSACKKSDTKVTKATSNDSTNILNPHVIQVSADQIATMGSIDSASISFPSGSVIADSAKVGSILVGGITSKTPRGFARIVTGKVSNGNTTTLQTTYATIDDIYDQAYINFSTSLRSDDTSTGSHRSAGSIAVDPILFPLPNLTWGSLTLSGELSYAPVFTFIFTKKLLSPVSYIELSMNLIDQSNFSFNKTGSLAVSKIPLHKWHLKPIVIPDALIYISNELDLDFNTTISKQTKYSIGCNNSYTVGIKYENGQWSALNSASLSAKNGNSPSIGDFDKNVSGSAMLELNLVSKLYDIDNLYNEIGAEAGFNATIQPLNKTPNYKFTVGGDAHEKVVASFFSKKLPEWTPDPVTFPEVLISQGNWVSGRIAKVDGDNQKGPGGQYLPIPLKVLVNDYSGNPLSNITVTFKVSNGGGQVENSSVTTDANGFAQTRLKLGTDPNAPQWVSAIGSMPDGTLIDGSPIGFTESIIGKSKDSLYIGKAYAGGIIFYLDSSGHGLVCATNDQGSIQWGCDSALVGASSFNNGKANTVAIVTTCGSNSAAYLCTSLRLGGYNDWYLPSLGELYQLYSQYLLIGGFPAAAYWSSTESDSRNAAGLGFITPGPGTGNAPKNFQYKVRAIRAF